MQKRNAVILAAGKSKRFAPFTYEKPKGLFRINGEILIERLIRQLQEAGIDDIYIVVGFMKERYFYLEQQFGVKLLVNNNFDHKGNLYSLYVARQYLGNTFVCYVDHYFPCNPFLEPIEHAYRICMRVPHREKFLIKFSDAKVITSLQIGGKSTFSMTGQAYFSEKFSKKFVSLLEKDIDKFGVDRLFWEEFYARHIAELTLYAEIRSLDYVYEFDSVEDLQKFDKEFLDNIDSEIIQNICKILKCQPHDIKNITVIQKGLTNVSFKFTANGVEYVYRHPGQTAGHLIDRQTEVIAQNKAVELGIDSSVIYIDPTGWKLSYFIQDMVPCDLNDPAQLQKCIQYMHKIHTICHAPGAKVFDPFAEAMHLLTVASAAKGNLKKDFKDLIDKVELLNARLKKEPTALVLCHNDTYAPNFLFNKRGDLYIIDWEYAGMNDPAYDLACIMARGQYSGEEIKRYIDLYEGRHVDEKTYQHYIAVFALCGFYWFCWGLYKGSVNDDDGFFMIPSYRSCLRFIGPALEYYGITGQVFPSLQE